MESLTQLIFLHKKKTKNITYYNLTGAQASSNSRIVPIKIIKFRPTLKPARCLPTVRSCESFNVGRQFRQVGTYIIM